MTLSALLKQPVYADRFKAVLGERQPQFVSSLLNVGSTMKDVDPRSIIGAAMTAAALDLTIDKNLGFAWIVPFRDKKRNNVKIAQFQLGYRGAIQLAQRSGQYGGMNAVSINQEVFQGWDSLGEPILDWNNYDPAAETWGYFFGFSLVNGFTKRVVWTKAKVLEHARKYSQAFRSGSDIWREQFDSMALKTVISNTLRKWGPLSIQMQQGLKADSAVIRDIDAEPEYLDDDGVDKPELDHPEKVKQVASEASAETTTTAKTETKAPAKTEAKAESKPETKPEPKKEPVKVAEPATPAKQPENLVQAPINVAREVKHEPATEPAQGSLLPAETAQPERTEEQVLAEMGIAPEPQSEATVETPAPPLTEAQMQLKEQIEAYGCTFADLVDWGSTKPRTLFSSEKPPTFYHEVSDEIATRVLRSMKGVIAALQTWKKSKANK